MQEGWPHKRGGLTRGVASQEGFNCRGLFKSWQPAKITPYYSHFAGCSKAVGTIFGLGGQKKFCAKFFLTTLFFKRIQFCSLVYLWFPISTELLPYLSHISIYWSISRCFYNLKFFGLAKYWGGNCPPPLPPLFLRPCVLKCVCIMYKYCLTLWGSIWPTVFRFLRLL